jgi:hypothetical protein
VHRDVWAHDAVHVRNLSGMLSLVTCSGCKKVKVQRRHLVVVVNVRAAGCWMAAAW